MADKNKVLMKRGGVSTWVPEKKVSEHQKNGWVKVPEKAPKPANAGK